MFERQRQEAGDNSQQIQATNAIIINNGITEDRARSIVDERLSAVLQSYSLEAHSLAIERVQKFADDLIPKLVKADLLESLKDPSVQILLSEAQKTATSTEREVDYGLLSELLIHRINKGTNRKIRAGISQAVKIVNEIADEALLGLTVSHCVAKFTPVTGLVSDGLSVLDSLFAKVIYDSLPSESDWLEHLEILNAVRISSIGTMKKVNQYYPEQFSDYVDIGIEVDSEAHNKAKDIVTANNLPQDILVAHELRDNYLRIPILSRDRIDQLTVKNHIRLSGNAVIPILIDVPFSDAQKQAVNDIYSLYETDQRYKQENITMFMQKWDSFANLKRLKDWWDAISISFNITSVGTVLAHANAQRCDPSLPAID
jgi:hypothetical protein